MASSRRYRQLQPLCSRSLARSSGCAWLCTKLLPRRPTWYKKMNDIRHSMMTTTTASSRQQCLRIGTTSPWTGCCRFFFSSSSTSSSKNDNVVHMMAKTRNIDQTHRKEPPTDGQQEQQPEPLPNGTGRRRQRHDFGKSPPPLLTATMIRGGTVKVGTTSRQNSFLDQVPSFGVFQQQIQVKSLYRQYMRLLRPLMRDASVTNNPAIDTIPTSPASNNGIKINIGNTVYNELHQQIRSEFRFAGHGESSWHTKRAISEGQRRYKELASMLMLSTTTRMDVSTTTTTTNAMTSTTSNSTTLSSSQLPDVPLWPWQQPSSTNQTLAQYKDDSQQEKP